MKNIFYYLTNHPDPFQCFCSDFRGVQARLGSPAIGRVNKAGGGGLPRARASLARDRGDSRAQSLFGAGWVGASTAAGLLCGEPKGVQSPEAKAAAQPSCALEPEGRARGCGARGRQSGKALCSAASLPTAWPSGGSVPMNTSFPPPRAGLCK